MALGTRRLSGANVGRRHKRPVAGLCMCTAFYVAGGLLGNQTANRGTRLHERDYHTRIQHSFASLETVVGRGAVVEDWHVMLIAHLHTKEELSVLEQHWAGGAGRAKAQREKLATEPDQIRLTHLRPGLRCNVSTNCVIKLSASVTKVIALTSIHDGSHGVDDGGRITVASITV